jgi:hypothetical protein
MHEDSDESANLLMNTKVLNVGGVFCHKEISESTPAEFDYVCESDECRVLVINQSDYTMAHDRVMLA